MGFFFSRIRHLLYPVTGTGALVPQGDITASETSHEWMAISDDPSFRFRPEHRPRRSGWYMLELNIDSTHLNGVAKLYIDFGNGLNESDTITLHYQRARTCKRLYHFHKRPLDIRFDPMERSGDFTIRHFRIARVPEPFARQRMMRKLSSCHPHYAGKTGDQIRRELNEMQRRAGGSGRQRLYEAYQSLFDQRSEAVDYADWIRFVEQPQLPDPRQVRTMIHGLQHRPVISIVLPVYNTRIELLQRCISSVTRQSWPYWELCIADDASTDPAIPEFLQAAAAQDNRIRLVLRETNGHISAATNSALQLCSGDYIAFLDHDDELAEHALLFVAKSINEHPAAKLLYSDEDKLDADGQRFDPHMKPDWNPDLLCAQNYIAHLAVIEAGHLRATGGLREGVEGSQDHDLMLRCTRSLRPEQIVHIPRVLYHWRAQQGSTAQSPGSKQYTTTAGMLALNRHFQEQAVPATASPGWLPNTYRIRYALPDPAPLVSIMVPTRDKVEVLRNCIDALLERTSYPSFEILVIDNRSSEPDALAYLADIAKDPRVRVLSYDHPFNYSAINNFAAQHANGDLLCLLNNDTEAINPDWLTEMVSHACRAEIGCVGAKLYYSDERIQHAGVILGIGGVAGHAHKYAKRDDFGYFSRLHLVQNYSAVTGACLVVRKSVYEQVGGLNETNLPVSFNDVDFCLRVADAGYRNLWTPYAELYHHESATRGADDTIKKQKRFLSEIDYMVKTWGPQLKLDPAYNPNLSLEKWDFSLAWPPRLE